MPTCAKSLYIAMLIALMLAGVSLPADARSHWRETSPPQAPRGADLNEAPRGQ